MANALSDPSLSQLRRETETTRAELVQTVNAIRTEVSDTASDMKRRISPREFYRRMEDRALANPLQALAIAAGVAYPAFRLLRAIPAPVLMIGAGIALANRAGASPSQGRGYGRAAGRGIADTVKDRVQTVVSDTTEAASDLADRAGAAVKSRVAGVRDAVSSARQQVAEAAADAKRTSADAVASAKEAGLQTAYNLRENAATTARDLRDGATRNAQRLNENVADTIEKHPLLVGGIGLAIGAFLAAALPVTRPENRFLGDASDHLKDQAREALAHGSQAAKNKVQQTFDDAKDLAEEHGLSADRMAQAVDDLKAKAERVVSSVTSATESGAASTERVSMPSGAATSPTYDLNSRRPQ